MIRTLLGHSFAYGVTTLFSRGTLLLLLLVLPFVLSPADYGALSLLIALGAIVNVVVPLEISQGLVRFYSSAPRGGSARYASTAWWFTVAALLGFVVAAEAFAEFLCGLVFGDLTYLSAFRVGMLLIAANGLFYFLANQFRWEFRTKGYAVTNAVCSVLTVLLALGLAFAFDRPLVGVIVGQFIAAMTAALIAVLALRGSLWARPDRDALRQMLRVSLPMVPANLALLFSLYASRFILSDLGSLTDVGVLAFASQVAGIASLALIGVQSAITPLVMARFDEPETPPAIARSFELFVCGATFLCLALGLFSPEVIDRLGDASYRGAGSYVLALAFSVIAGAVYVFAPGFLIAQKTGQQMWLSVASAALCVAANFILIPRFGVAGAVAASLLSSLVFAGLWFWLSQRLYPIPIRWSRFLAGVGGVAAIGAAASAVTFDSLLMAMISKSAMLALALVLLLALGLLPFRAVANAAKGLAARVSSGQLLAQPPESVR